MGTHVTSPDAIVIFQPRPGTVAGREVESLHRQAPLARLVLLTGPWCDGERHRHEPLPGLVRIRWHQWRQRLPVEVSGQSRRLPRTATEAERLESALRGLSGAVRTQGRAAISTSRRARLDALAGACQALGWQAIWLQNSARSQIPQCDLLLIDGWEQLPAAADSAAGVNSPRILLLSFPRPEDLQRAAEHGIRAVIAEPILLPSLAAVFVDFVSLAARSGIQQSVA